MTRIGITGHQNLSPDVEQYAAKHISEILAQYSDVTGISCLAVGADQVFARAVLKLGGSLEVIVPAHDYRQTFASAVDLHGYDALMVRAATVISLPFSRSSEIAYYEAGREVVRRCDQLIAVWDGQPARGKGGTSDVVQFARSHGKPMTIVWPEGTVRD